MRDAEIDRILKQAAMAPHDVDPALLDRIAGSVGRSLHPVRPLRPPAVLAGGLVLLCAAVSFAGADLLGLHGIQKMTALERALIFPVLAIQFALAAIACVRERTPGSRRRVAPGVLLWAGSLATLAVFAILFRDYRTDRFLPQGAACLIAGLLQAAPAALGIWLIVRRGYAVNRVSAGLVAGTLAGLAGVAMLEFHCPNFQAPHLMLWHTAVVPIAGAAGALLGRIGRSQQPLRQGLG